MTTTNKKKNNKRDKLRFDDNTEQHGGWMLLKYGFFVFLNMIHFLIDDLETCV